MRMKLTTILTIAGSDSSGGAGIQADIKAADLCHVFATTAVTAVTAQSTGAVSAILPMPDDVVEAQLNSIIEDQIPDAVKIGMLASTENGEAIARFIENSIAGVPVVIDPVLSATSGKDLSPSIHEMLRLYRDRLLPLATAVTPNLREAALFLGKPADYFKDCNTNGLSEIARGLLELFNCKAVILKGGHTANETVADVAAVRTSRGCQCHVAESPKIDCHNLHGTGCTLSTLLACEMAKGTGIEDAFYAAVNTIKKIIAASRGYDYGHSCNGVLNTNNYNLKTI